MVSLGAAPEPAASSHAVSGAMPGAVPPPGYGAQPAHAPQPGYAPAYPPQPGNGPQPGPGNQPHPGSHAPQQLQFNQQAAAFGNDVGNAFNSFGSALGSFVNSAVGSVTQGSHVMVQWSDGQRYPGTVTMMQGGQVQVAFPDGRQVWVPQQYVTPRNPGF